MIGKKALAFVFVAAAWVTFAPQAPAQESYPCDSIEIIVHRDGGSTYVGAQIVAEALQKSMDVPVVVRSLTAGAGTAAPSYVANEAEADGCTLYSANSGTNGTMPQILDVPYSNADFDYLVLYGTQSMVLVVQKDARWQTLDQLVQEAKENPGKLTYSTSSTGAQSHFVMELFKLEAGGLQIDQVPFTSGRESVTALLGGHVDVGSAYMAGVKGHLEAGTLRILAVPEKERLEDYPDVPTFAEAGYPGVVSVAWFGIGAPKGLPEDIKQTLEEHLYKVVRSPEVKEALTKIGYKPAFMKADEFESFVFEQEKIFSRIAKEANIRIQ